MKKKFLISCIGSVAALCLSIGSVGIYADADQPSAQSTGIISDLQMLKGAYIRAAEEKVEASNCGIRYSLTMSATEYNDLMQNVGEDKTYTEVKFGIFISVASLNIEGKEIAKEEHVMGENAIYYWEVDKDENGSSIFNVENPDKSKMKQIICAEGTEMTQMDNAMYFYGSVVNMKEENLKKDYVGVGYVKYTTNGETHYQFATANDNVRSMEDIARTTYNTLPDMRETLTELYLKKTPLTCTVETAPTAKATKATGEAQELITAGVANEYATMMYSLDNETWSKEIPTATDSDIYTVYYKAVGQTEHDIESEVQSLKVILKTENDEITLAPAKIVENKVDATIVGFGGTYEYIGLGSYSVGDVLEFTFTGKNIPNVGLFANADGVNPVGGGTENTGIYLQTSGHGTLTFIQRLYIAGPFLADAGSAEPYHTLTGRESYVPKTELGKNLELGVDISNTGNTSLFAMDMLEENTNYIYRVWTSAVNAIQVNIHFALYTVKGTEVKAAAAVTKTITHYLPSLENRYAVVYGAGSYYNQDITFGYTAKPDYDITPTVGSLTMKTASVTEVKENGTLVGFNGTYDYYGLGSYKVGDVLEFSFTGKNIPNLGLFVNKNGVNPLGGGTENTGIFLQTSGYGTSTFSKRLYIAGPFLLDAGSVDAYHTVSGLETYAYKGELGKNKELAVDISNTGNTSLFGMDMLTDGTNYVYKVWTEASASVGKVIVKAALYTVAEDGTRTLATEISKEIVHYLDSLENRYAVVYGSGAYYGKSITFDYEVIRQA